MADGVPNDVNRRIDVFAMSGGDATMCKIVLRVLDGRAPARLGPGGVELLMRETGLERDELARALAVLERAGVDGAGAPSARRRRVHGHRLEQRLRGILGRLPRSLALRLPSEPYKQPRRERLDGRDVYGPVRCSRVLRDGHLGALAGLCGMWHAWARLREDGVDRHVEFTAGELAFLLRVKHRSNRRGGGADLRWIHGVMRDLAPADGDRPGLELVADVDEGEYGASEAHRIPCAPLTRVERRLDGEWVDIRDFEAALGEASATGRCGQAATFRVTFADWVLDELRDPKRRPVYVNLHVWRALPNALSRRLYVWLQASHQSPYDRKLRFYLGDPLCFTLGLQAERLDRREECVRHCLMSLYRADVRYNARGPDGSNGFSVSKRPGTNIPAFGVHVAGVSSRPSPAGRTQRMPARRPCANAVRLVRPRLTGSDVHPHELDAAHVADVGLEAAREQAARIRERALTSLLAREAGTPARAGPSP